MVPEGLLIDRFLCSEGKTTSTNHYHDEQVKIAQVHYKVTEATNSAKQENPNVMSQLTVKVEIIVVLFLFFFVSREDAVEQRKTLTDWLDQI